MLSRLGSNQRSFRGLRLTAGHITTLSLEKTGTGGENRTHLKLRVKQAASPEVDTGKINTLQYQRLDSYTTE